MLKKAEILRLKQVDHIISENTILSNINHPFLVIFLSIFCLKHYFFFSQIKMIGFTQDERFLYLILEYIQGGELFTYLRNKGKFENNEALYQPTNLLKYITPSQILRCAGCLHVRISPRQEYNLSVRLFFSLSLTPHLQRSEARKYPDRRWWICETDRFWFRQIPRRWQNLYPLRHARVPGARDPAQQGTWQAGRLVDVGNPDIWNVSRLGLQALNYF